MPTRTTIRILAVALFLWSIPGHAGPSTIEQLTAFLAEAKMDKVQVKRIGPLAVLTGEVDIPDQLDKIERVLSGLRKAEPALVVENLVSLCPGTWMMLAERVERELGSAEITVRFVNRSLLIEGVAESDFEADRAVVIAQAMLRLPASFPLAVSSMKPSREVTAMAEMSPDAIRIIDMLRVRPRSGVKGKRVGSLRVPLLPTPTGEQLEP